MPTPPNTTSPSCISTIGTMPPSGVKESCIALTAPHEAAVVMAANRPEASMPKRTSLPSMLPPACIALAAWSTPSGAEQRIAGLLGRDDHDHGHDEHHRHGRQHGPALAHVADHAAEGEAQRGRDQEDRQHLDEVGQRRRVLVRDAPSWR